MNTLNLKKTSAKEVEHKWNVGLPYAYHLQPIYVKCDRKGNINWESGRSTVYTEDEIKKRTIVLH